MEYFSSATTKICSTEKGRATVNHRINKKFRRNGYFAASIFLFMIYLKGVNNVINLSGLKRPYSLLALILFSICTFSSDLLEVESLMELPSV